MPHCQSTTDFSVGGEQMPPSLLLLLLCCLLSVDSKRFQRESTRKPNTFKSMRLAKADDGAKHSIIDLSDDINNEPDSRGEFTMTSLSKPDMPRDFTICTAFMVKAWTTDFTAADLFELRADDGHFWASIYLYASGTFTEFNVLLGKVYFITTINSLLFPFTWTRVCLSLDTILGKVGFVVNGQLVQ